MKLSVTSAALVLALTTAITAAPAEDVKVNSLSRKDYNQLRDLSASLDAYNKAKRDTGVSPTELAVRESETITSILELIKDTDLAGPIIDYLVTNSTLGPIISDLIVAIVQSGAINLTTLLTALNDSGLAVDVIDALVNDCAFYQTIFSIVGQVLSDLPQIIFNLITGTSKVRRDIQARDVAIYHQQTARNNGMKRSQVPDIDLRDTEYDILNSVFESLKDSGLAVQVVESLVTDEDFLQWGAELIVELFSSGALTISELISAIAASGLVPSLIQEFLSISTLEAVIVNSLAAAFGNCGSSLNTSSAQSGVSVSIPTASTTASGTPISISALPSGGKCRKRRRSYNY